MTANELHRYSNDNHLTPTFIKLLSADTDHSFWVPRLAGKTDLIPNHLVTWIDPYEPGIYLGQCAQCTGTQTPTSARSCSSVLNSMAGFSNNANRQP